MHTHAGRRVGGGRDFELILANDVSTAGKELQYALERVSLRVIGEQLCDLDSSMGLSVSRLIMTRFNLLRSRDKLEHQDLSPETGQSYSSGTLPLALAAHASAHSGDVIDVSNVPDEKPDGPGTENAEIPLNSDTHGSWE